MLKSFHDVKSVLGSVLMTTFQLKDQIQEDFSKWVHSHNMDQEEKEAIRRQLWVQSEILLKREDLKEQERLYIESIVKVLE